MLHLDHFYDYKCHSDYYAIRGLFTLTSDIEHFDDGISNLLIDYFEGVVAYVVSLTQSGTYTRVSIISKNIYTQLIQGTISYCLSLPIF